MYKNRKPDRKPDRTTRKNLCANEPVCQNKFSYIRIILIQPSEVEKPDRKPDPGLPGKFYVQMNSMSKEICIHKNFFNRTIRSAKTGNRSENRTPDQPEIFMDKLVCQYKFVCIGIFSIRPTVKKI